MRRRGAVTLALLLVVVALPVWPAAEASGGTGGEPTVVVAVADSGVNPYHEIYHRPDLTAHPCTYVAGYDCSIPSLPLSIGVYDTVEEAFEADRELWESVELHQWYWIPGTNIIGAVCEGSGSLTTSIGDCIFDNHGHGTGTTSSILTEEPDALLLVHEGNAGAYDLEHAPVVPDLQSHSWGPLVPLPLQVVEPVVPGEPLVCGDGAFDPETIFFIAAGNNAPFPSVLDCSRVHNRVQVVGGGYPGEWTPVSWSAYDFASWFCRPTARHDSITAQRDSYCGTSFSAPTAAGAAAAALLEIRRREGYGGRSTEDMVSASISRDEFVDALRAAATYDPEAKFPNRSNVLSPGVPVPQEAPWLFWGYGWLDSTVSGAVVACALDGECPDKPQEAEDWNATRRQVRAASSEDAWGIPAQDDAGSGRDAGATLATAVPIAPGRAYDAELFPVGPWGDDEDWFTFDARAGQEIHARADGTLWCLRLYDDDGGFLTSACSVKGQPAELEATAPADGTYVLAYTYFAPPQPYRFSVGLDRPAPPL